jgi:hypothetical protein
VVGFDPFFIFHLMLFIEARFKKRRWCQSS